MNMEVPWQEECDPLLVNGGYAPQDAQAESVRDPFFAGLYQARIQGVTLWDN